MYACEVFGGAYGPMGPFPWSRTGPTEPARHAECGVPHIIARMIEYAPLPALLCVGMDGMDVGVPPTSAWWSTFVTAFMHDLACADARAKWVVDVYLVGEAVAGWLDGVPWVDGGNDDVYTSGERRPPSDTDTGVCVFIAKGPTADRGAYRTNPMYRYAQDDEWCTTDETAVRALAIATAQRLCAHPVLAVSNSSSSTTMYMLAPDGRRVHVNFIDQYVNEGDQRDAFIERLDVPAFRVGVDLLAGTILTRYGDTTGSDMERHTAYAGGVDDITRAGTAFVMVLSSTDRLLSHTTGVLPCHVTVEELTQAAFSAVCTGCEYGHRYTPPVPFSNIPREAPHESNPPLLLGGLRPRRCYQPFDRREIADSELRVCHVAGFFPGSDVRLFTQDTIVSCGLLPSDMQVVADVRAGDRGIGPDPLTRGEAAWAPSIDSVLCLRCMHDTPDASVCLTAGRIVSGSLQKYLAAAMTHWTTVNPDTNPGSIFNGVSCLTRDVQVSAGTAEDVLRCLVEAAACAAGGPDAARAALDAYTRKGATDAIAAGPIVEHCGVRIDVDLRHRTVDPTQFNRAVGPFALEVAVLKAYLHGTLHDSAAAAAAAAGTVCSADVGCL